MKVTLIQYDNDALELLLFTKQTRLRMTEKGLDEIRAWSDEKKMAELEYMLGTIQSSWEFASYTFMIEDVSRAFTHQLVRHRVGVAFAQQSQRAVDMTGFDYVTGPNIEQSGSFDQRAPIEGAEVIYDTVMDQINSGYQTLIQLGVPPQDARGVLPTNICTNIVFKANLRTLHEMALKRLCVKTQGEFQDVFRAIREAVLVVHPWADRMIRVHCAVTGTCCFPSFPVAQCSVKRIVYDPKTRQAYGGGLAGSLEEIQTHWQQHRDEAQVRIPRSED